MPLIALAALATMLPVRPAFAACGDGVVDGIEQCDGGGCCEIDCTFSAAETECRPAVSPACDLAEACDGSSGECPADVLVGCIDTDSVVCTVPVCTAEGECIQADGCIETCRGPGFWGKHSGDEKDGVNLGQSVLDQSQPQVICGNMVHFTNTGKLDSVLEALCVRTQGVKMRQLFRQLMTTGLNCAISEGGTCDQITSRFIDVSFDDCNQLCAEVPVENGPTLRQCKHQLACFNDGGRMIEGQCAKGSCAEDSETLCGGDYGDCPAVGDAPQDCERFEDSCAAGDLCTTDLTVKAEICPDKTRASSAKACQEARRNTCTIDSCEGFVPNALRVH